MDPSSLLNLNIYNISQIYNYQSEEHEIQPTQEVVKYSPLLGSYLGKISVILDLKNNLDFDLEIG